MKKKFDCVDMKNEIQARLLSDQVGLTGPERVTTIQHALDRSKSPIGGLWRKLKDREEGRVARVAEDREKYGKE
jgi:hypothetical protein